MSALDHQNMIDSQGKWQFVYNQMMHSSTFTKFKSKIEAFHQDKLRNDQLKMELDQKYGKRHHKLRQAEVVVVQKQFLDEEKKKRAADVEIN